MKNGLCPSSADPALVFPPTPTFGVRSYSDQRRIFDRQRLASTATPPHSIRLCGRAVPQLDKPAPDRAARHAGNLRNRTNPAMTRCQRLRRRISPPPTLIQQRLKRLKSNPNRSVVNHESFLYPRSHQGNPVDINLPIQLFSNGP